MNVLGIGGRMSGTSMATPIVARAAANLQSVPGFPGMKTPRRVLINSGGESKILNQEKAVMRLLELARRRSSGYRLVDLRGRYPAPRGPTRAPRRRLTGL